MQPVTARGWGLEQPDQATFWPFLRFGLTAGGGLPEPPAVPLSNRWGSVIPAVPQSRQWYRCAGG
jgi:hypothetical protein